jgi:hypothetical protein
MFDRTRWLARLSFSFIIVALVLLWQAQRLWRESGRSISGTVLLCLVGAVAAGTLGAAGIRARHRP